MRTPSRRMPAFVPQHSGAAGWALLLTYVLGLAYACVNSPLFAAIVAVAAVVICIQTTIETRRQRRLIARRGADSICTFARSFNCREIDTWIVRAVFEEIGQYTKVPVRANDRLAEDLSIDPDDLDEIVSAISQRTGRPLHHSEQNAWFDRLERAGDLVRFFAHQAHQPGRAGISNRS
jgi:hypothetical protein